MLLLHPGPTVNPVVLAAFRRNLQAVSSNEGRLTELKPERKHRGVETHHADREVREVAENSETSGHLLVKAVAGFDEGVELLVGVLDHVRVQLYAMIHPERSCSAQHDAQ